MSNQFAEQVGIESWRRVWRDGFVPSFVDVLGKERAALGVQLLHRALKGRDPAVRQGVTTFPGGSADLEGCSPEVYVAWVSTVSSSPKWSCQAGDAMFGALCVSCDGRVGMERACRFFMNWWDETPAHVAYPALAAECLATLDFLATGAWGVAPAPVPAPLPASAPAVAPF